MRVASGDHRGVSEIDFSVRELVLVRAVVVHHPDFLVAALAAHIGDLRLRDSGQAAAQHADDVVGELMREAAGVARPSRRRDKSSAAPAARSGLCTSERKPATARLAAIDGHIAVRHHVSVGRSRSPVRRFHLARLARNLRGIKARADHVEHAGIFQIGPQHIVKSLFERLRRRPTHGDIRSREPRLCNSQARAGLEPILRRGGQGSAQRQN